MIFRYYFYRAYINNSQKSVQGVIRVPFYSSPQYAYRTTRDDLLHKHNQVSVTKFERIK